MAGEASGAVALRRDAARDADGARGSSRRGLRRWTGAILSALVTTFLVCRFSAVLSVPEFAMLDVWLRARPARQPTPLIALVGITRDAVDDYAQVRDTECPGCVCRLVCRRTIGEAVSRLKKAGARVVAMDMVFSQPCPVGFGTEASHDAPLTAALELPGDTILIPETESNPGEKHFRDLPPDVLGDAEPIIASPILHSRRGVVRGVGLVQQGVPQAGERKRAEPLVMVAKVCPPLCMAVFAAYRRAPDELPVAVDHDTVRCAGVDVPVLSSETVVLMPAGRRDANATGGCLMLINWAGPIGTFPLYSLTDDVLPAEDSYLAKLFRGKVVLIGSLTDRLKTPLERRWALPRTQPVPGAGEAGEIAMSGLEIHANALDTLIQRRFLRPLPKAATWALVACLALAVVIAFQLTSTWRAVLVMGVAIVGLFGVAWLLIQHDIWLYTAVPVTAVLVAGVPTAVWGHAVARQQAAFLAGQVEARDAVRTTLAHDLKQPLSVINALAAALRVQKDGGELSPELLDRIQDQVRRALGDIDDLLTADPGRKLSLQLATFDLVALARGLAAAHSLESSYHEVEVSAPTGDVAVRGDPRYLGRALSNLIGNATKYWPEGGTVTVDVSAEPEAVLVNVVDGGMGISPDRQKIIFEPFERAVPDGSNIPGTGIGLFSVKRIVEAHGGSVSVTSSPGSGSTFTLRLPVMSVANAVDAEVSEP